MSLTDIPTALAALRDGKPVIVADDESRENEGDVVLAAHAVTQEWLAWTIRHTSGFLCAPMTNDIADRLGLPLMVVENQDRLNTAYTVSVDAADRMSTGISAADRAHTLRVLADANSTPASLNRPGHILPLRALDGGVLERPGHTEATVDLLKLAGLVPVGAIAEIVTDDGDMMRLPGLIELGASHNIPVITITGLIDYLHNTDRDGSASPPVDIPESSRVLFEVETTIPTAHGLFRFRAYRDRITGAEHLAIISGTPTEGAILRVHSECLTGEVFHSLKCECGPQLTAALELIAQEGGVVIYMRGHEGRGIGLVNKLKAYRMQEEGLDTLDANLALGFPADNRDYSAAAAILDDLALSQVTVVTNNPDKVHQLEECGITVIDRVPLVVGVSTVNESYLNAKRDRMGHAIPSPAELMQPTTRKAESV
ncbi:MAG: 3,4-dihydroxy-2-butanone-4-phosphate synthase [Rhodoglobus sp.]